MIDATLRSPQARAGYALTSLPFILLVILIVLAPGYMDPAFANPPDLLGLPMGVVLLFIALVWAVSGILVARGGRSNARIALALAAFALPASMAVILVAPLILIIQNSAT